MVATHVYDMRFRPASTDGSPVLGELHEKPARQSPALLCPLHPAACTTTRKRCRHLSGHGRGRGGIVSRPC
jgi:hypothetical protein